MSIDKNANKTALEFMEHVTRITSRLPLDNVLYWSRRWRALQKIFEEKVTFLKYLNIDTAIPALPACKTIETFHKGTPFKRGDEEIEELVYIKKNSMLPKEYSETFESIVSGYELGCDLEIEQVFRFLGKDVGGQKALLSCSFSPMQIKHLAQRQNRINRPGPLTYEESNHFLIVDKRQKLSIVTLHRGSRTKMRWNYFFHFQGRTNMMLREKSRLFLV